MKKSIKKISAFEQLIKDAKDSKHTEAVLLLNEKKPEIQAKVVAIMRNTFPEIEDEASKKATEVIKKSIASFAEFVFQNCVSILVDDKK